MLTGLIHRFDADWQPILARLFTIAKNRIGEHRGQVRPRPVDDRPLTDLTAQHNPERDVITRDTAFNVLRCIGGLRDNYRRVLLCRFLDRLTPQETADRMECSWVSVRNWQR